MFEKKVFLIIVLSFVFLGINQKKVYPQEENYIWITIQDDDGTMESYWGQSGYINQILCKIIKLDIDPGQIKEAKIKYLMGANPYHNKTMTYYSEQVEGVNWADMVILVNDNVIIQKPAIKLATKGWHEVSINPQLLKKGDNTIKFTWAKIPEGNPQNLSYGYFYLGIDTSSNHHRSCSSNDYGKTFTFDTLRPGSAGLTGEYMVRLEIAVSKQ